MTYLVLGAGKTGLSCLDYLISCGYICAIYDQCFSLMNLDYLRQTYPQVSRHEGELSANLLQNAQQIFLSPGIPLDNILAIDPTIYPKLTNDIELFLSLVKAPVIAITGTNGKGTVVTLVKQMIIDSGLTVLEGGNIGIPVLTLLAKSIPDFYVLEISSFQLELHHSFHFKVATILNMTPDHLDRYPNFTAYAQTKHKIYEQAQNCVYNRDDPYTLPSSKPLNFNSFGLGAPKKTHEWGTRLYQNNIWLYQGKRALFNTQDLKITGQHNWLNALAALAISHIIGLPLHSCQKTLVAFKSLEHRCEQVNIKHQVAWYNDSKGTNVGATAAAITSLGSMIKGKIVLIAGGLGKNNDFSFLVPSVTQYVKVVILLGKDADKIASALMITSIPIHRVITLDQAVNQAYEQARAGDIVLLSPACASWDMFANFEERGKIFKHLITQMG